MKDGSVTLPLGSVNVQPGTRMRFFVRESDYAKREVEALWMGYKKQDHFSKTLKAMLVRRPLTHQSACFFPLWIEAANSLVGNRATKVGRLPNSFRRFPALDTVLGHAGGCGLHPFATTSEADYDRIFRFPNAITEKDFEGWVQERGLYFMDRWDNHFRPLLSSADPGEPAREGGLLRARYGRGTYIYTGYAFFRQLPNGVPGAIRFYVNLLSAGHGKP